MTAAPPVAVAAGRCSPSPAAAPRAGAEGLPLRPRVPRYAVRQRQGGRGRRPGSAARARRSARPWQRARKSWPRRWRATGARAKRAAEPARARSAPSGPPRRGRKPQRPPKKPVKRPRRTRRTSSRPCRAPKKRAPQVAVASGERLGAHGSGLGLQAPVLGPQRLASTPTCCGSTGMQATGHTCTHCGSSKWPTHSVQRGGSIS